MFSLNSVLSDCKLSKEASMEWCYQESVAGVFIDSAIIKKLGIRMLQKCSLDELFFWYVWPGKGF